MLFPFVALARGEPLPSSPPGTANVNRSTLLPASDQPWGITPASEI